jgi:radical S-adenosyl methionine domain-containing protein 2
MNNLVVNWHITEKCNYQCKFCFAKWDNQNEIWNSFDKAKFILENINSIWKPSYRLNFVGGEPLLFPTKIIPIMKYAISLGMNISVQTNGTNLEILVPIVRNISQIGISIDSWNSEKNKNIGRCCGAKTLNKDTLLYKINLLRNAGGDFKLKINTVVNEWNWDDVVIPQMEELGCNRIKILRQMPFGSAKGISEEQFYTFIRCNYRERLPIYVEDNDLMRESYLMIAPDGKLFQNTPEGDYVYSASLLSTNFSDAIKQINFDIEKFDSRYKSDKTDLILKTVFGNGTIA